MRRGLRSRLGRILETPLLLEGKIVSYDGRMTLDQIRQNTLDVLSKHLKSGDHVALVDFPNHGNSGDSLIYLGELEYLKLLGVEIDYVADASRYDPEDLIRRVPEGPVLIHGGGNFGDRWKKMQAMRERVISDFPDRRIIQLPQSIEFGPGPDLVRAQRILGNHKQLTLLIRDHSGVARTKDLFPGATTEFCPDMAFGFGRVKSKGKSKFDVVFLKRGDSESILSTVNLQEGYLLADWGLSGWRRGLSMMLRVPGAVAKKLPSAAMPLYFIQRRCYDALARLHVSNAIRLLSQGRTVVTDRLHATVLSGLMGKPVVALDNANGKVSAIFDDYLSGLPGVNFASAASANEAVGGLLRRNNGDIE